jgi:hypothetical protein
MVSMLENLSTAVRTEKADQGTQTDLIIPSASGVERTRQTRPGLLDGKMMTVAIRRGGIQFSFK